MFIRGKENDLSNTLKRVNEFETKGKINKAISELQKAIKLNPEDGNFYNRLGDLYIRDNQVQAAVEAYKKGVEAYRNNTFSRNAIALSRKILRYDPESTASYLVIAELLVELDEKNDALQYFFEYIEKRRAQKNVDEVLKTLGYIRGLGILNPALIKRINDTYKAIGRDDLVKKFTAQVKEESIINDSVGSETPVTTHKKIETETEKNGQRKGSVHMADFDKEKRRFKDNITQLDTAAKDIERTIAQLRKAMRLDEVIIALDSSLTTLSNEQKKAIALLQKSLSLNLDTLQKSVQNLHKSSDKNIKDLEILLNKLNKALASLSKNQASLAQRMNESLEKVSTSINATTKGALEEIKSILGGYKKATDDMCRMFSETKDCNMSLLKIIEEMNITGQKMNDSLTAFITLHDLKVKKHGRYALIIITITAVISVLLLFSIIR